MNERAVLGEVTDGVKWALGSRRERAESRVPGLLLAPRCSRAPRLCSLGFFLICKMKGWSLVWGFVLFTVVGLQWALST